MKIDMRYLCNAVRKITGSAEVQPQQYGCQMKLFFTLFWVRKV